MMNKFHIGSSGFLDDLCLSKLMVHVKEVEENRKKRGVRDGRIPKPQHLAGLHHGGHKNNFGIHDKPSSRETKFRKL